MQRILFLITMMTLTSVPASPVRVADLTGPTYRDVRIREGYATAMPSTGTVNMLVIPINFSDAHCGLIEEGCEQTLTNIDQAFFGNPSTMRWHSVASYYHASSYGQLTIGGLVTDWYTPAVTAVELSNNRGLLGNQVVNPAIDYFKQSHPDLVPQFDRDQDGYFDAVYFIYSLPFAPEEEVYGEDKDVFWAFVAYQGGQANVGNPTLFHYGWSSYQFMYEDGYYQRSANGKVEWDDNNEPIFFPWKNAMGQRQVDAHVYIHEVGHLLGLQDYYSYNQEEGDWGPAGTLDMMDYNVGDHASFSKMALGWLTPFIPVTSGTFSLTAMANAPVAVLLPKANATTMMDEYILIEFYQPIGLNEKDSRESYAGRYPRMFTQAGIKIYHIDARIAQLAVTSEGLQFDQYVTTMQPSGFRYQIAHSNTMSRNAVGTNRNFKLIHLLEASGQNTFRNGGFATNATLWQPGQSFNTDAAPFYFNDGMRLPWQLTAGSIQGDRIQLSLIYLPT